MASSFKRITGNSEFEPKLDPVDKAEIIEDTKMDEVLGDLDSVLVDGGTGEGIL